MEDEDLEHEDWGESWYDEETDPWTGHKGKLDMEEVTEWVDENRYEIDARGARQFLNRHADQIDWNEFEDWSKEVWYRDGYEWLHRVYASSENAKFKRAWR